MDIDIRGLEKFSLVEWPGKISGIIFTGGCNLRCPFCHNPELIDVSQKDSPSTYPWEEVEKFLETKKDWLDAIIVTGGEPTLQKELPNFLNLIKQKNFLTALETNGTNPEMLDQLVKRGLLDRIQMDVKTDPKNYAELAGVKNFNFGKIKKSVEIIKSSRVEYDFRTTVVPGLVDKREIKAIGKFLSGSQKIVLQQFRPIKTFDKNYQKAVPYAGEKILEMKKILNQFVAEVEINGLDY